MFEELTEKLELTLKKIRGTGKLTEKNISEALREVRRVLLEADVNYKVVKQFIASVQERAVGQDVLQSITPGQQIIKIVHDEMINLLGKASVPLNYGSFPPAIIMVAGLQGAGKTTFIGKLGKHLQKQGRYPLFVAADIYRPAAVDQLKTLGDSIKISVFYKENTDPVNLAKAAVSEARKCGNDTLILDTAGRLHVDETMMAELQAIQEAVNPSETLFVVDSMTGQDAVRSAKSFADRINIDGIVLSKLDGDAKGGAALSIRAVTGKPVKFVSLGEKLDTLEPFHPDRMAGRILGMGDVLTLVEKAQELTDTKEAEKLARKIKKQSFTLEDFYDQLQQVKKMGPMDQILSMMPGMGKQMKGLQVDDSALIRIEAMINSMTKEERQKPQIINGSRRKRIATGSGTTVQDLNRLLKQFQMMQKMMKQMHRMNPKKMSRHMPMAWNM